MKLSRILNITIIALVITAVLQTGKLWFNNNGSHNFFYTAFVNIGGDDKTYSGERYILEPKEIVAGYGNKKFYRFYASADKTGIYTMGNRAISEIVSKGDFVERRSVDWNELLSPKCLIFKYSGSVNSNEFLSGFEKSFDAKTDFYFDTIFIYPQMDYSSNVDISFIDTVNNQEFKYNVKKSRVSKELYDLIENSQNFDNSITYISTKQSGFNIFSDDIFVPQWPDNKLNYNIVKRVNPFEINGEFSLNSLENYIDEFFESGTLKWSETDKTGSYLFSDDNTVVKYTNNGLIEYYNYEPVDKDVNQSFITAYSTAKSFMERDKELETDIYLLDWKENGDEIVFCFNYTVNNLPLIPSEILMGMTNMDCCLEISVKNNSVRKYRRIAYNYEKDTKTAVANKEFIRALDETVMMRYENSEESVITNVDDIKLGYYISGRDNLKLKWFTTIDGEMYSVESEK